MARSFHPDVNPDPTSHDRMARINAAFETLIDPVRRMEYDASLNGGIVNDPTPDARDSRAAEAVRVGIVHRLRHHRTPLYSLTFAPDTGQMLTGSFDNELHWWDLAGGVPARSLRLDGGVVSTLRAVGNERVVAAGLNETQVSVWRLEGGAVRQTRLLPIEWIGCADISPDGRRLALGSVHRTVHTLDTETMKPLFVSELHRESVTAVSFSPTGDLLASGSADATVRIWEPQTGLPLDSLQAVRSTVSAIAWSPDGSLLAVAAVDLSIRIFEVRKGRLLKTFFGHEKPIESMAFHPDGWLLASVGRDGFVGLWDTTRGVGHGKIEASHLPLNAVGFTRDGTILVAGGLDKVVRVWRLALRAP